MRLVGDSRDGWRPFVAANIAGARPPDHSQRGWRAQRRLWRRDLRRPSHSNYLYFSNTSYLDSIAGHRGQPAAGSPEESRDLGRSLDRAAKNRSQELPPRGLRNTGADQGSMGQRASQLEVGARSAGRGISLVHEARRKLDVERCQRHVPSDKRLRTPNQARRPHETRIDV